MTQIIRESVKKLPESEQEPAGQLNKRLVLAWDPEYTMLLLTERKLEDAKHRTDSGEYVNDCDIDWNSHNHCDIREASAWHSRRKIRCKQGSSSGGFFSCTYQILFANPQLYCYNKSIAEAYISERIKGVAENYGSYG